MLREKLPVENYELFKYIVEFLVKVRIGEGGFDFLVNAVVKYNKF